jgi:PadR family transcriptional regulator PadR
MQSERLVETYLVESSSGPPRKYYKLTTSGRASLAAQTIEWTAFSKAVNTILGEPQ